MERFNVQISNKALSVFADGVEILREVRILMSYTRIHDVLFVPAEIKNADGESVVIFERAENTVYKEASHLSLRCVETGRSLALYLTAIGSRFPLSPTRSAKITFDLPEDRDGLVSLCDNDPCWLGVSFEQNPQKFSQFTESVSARLGDKHIHLLPISREKLSARIDGAALALHTRAWGEYSIEDVPVLSISCESDPYLAISTGIDSMRSVGVISALPVRERAYPKQMEGLGWCTWEAIGSALTPEKIYACLDEFKKKNICLRWVIIDDGWGSYNHGMLSAFTPDREKFPDGLAPVIETIKTKYGIDYVGIWCAAHGHWRGVDPDGEIAREHPDCIFKCEDGSLRPGHSREATFKFWDLWFGYLSDAGVDFVKIDVQGSLAAKFDGFYLGSAGCREQHEGLDAAAEKYFSGAMINCMGATLEDALARPTSALVRCSGDFSPTIADHFARHITQGVFVSALLGEFHYCDFDMFFSKHRWAEGYGILSAISGGPLYISDKAGESDKALIDRLAYDDGSTPRFAFAARPTLDCFYANNQESGEALKVFNVSGKNIAIAAFGVSRGRESFGRLRLSNIPARFLSAEGYIARDFITGKYFKLDKKKYFDFTVPYETARLFTLYPIDEDGYVELCDSRLYSEGASAPTARVHYKELL